MPKNLNDLMGFDPRVRNERLADESHKRYAEMLQRAVSSGEIPEEITAFRAIPVPRAIAGAEQKTVTEFSKLQAAIDAAQPGDTVFLADGSYSGGSQQIRLKAGVKLLANYVWTVETKDGIQMKVPKPKASIKWDNMPKGTNWAQKQCFAMLVPSGASNVTVEGVGLHSNNGVFFIEANTQNIKILHNESTWGWNGNYYSRHFIYTPGPVNTLIWEENYLHGWGDASNQRSGDRNCELWSVTNLQYNFNIFYNINDVGHLMNLSVNSSMSFNFGRRIHRMGVEVQQDRWPGPDPRNFIVKGNVFYDWDEPYWDSMGMSIPSYSTNILIEDNYVKVNAFNGKWGQADSSGKTRGSYWLECPQGTSLVRNNIFGGERSVGGYVRPGDNATIGEGNQGYGDTAWYNNNPVGGEPGSSPGNPTGTVSQVKYSRNIADMPKPPPQPVRDGSGGGGTPPTPQTKLVLGKVEAFTSFFNAPVSGEKSGGAVVEWRGKDKDPATGLLWHTGANIVEIPDTYKVPMDPAKYANWHIWVRARDSVGFTAEQEVQMSQKEDPVTPVPVEFLTVPSTPKQCKVPVENGVPNFAKATLISLLIVLLAGLTGCGVGSPTTPNATQSTFAAAVSGRSSPDTADLTQLSAIKAPQSAEQQKQNRLMLQGIVDALPNLANGPEQKDPTGGVCQWPRGYYEVDGPVKIKPGCHPKGWGTSTIIRNRKGPPVVFHTDATNGYVRAASVSWCTLVADRGNAVDFSEQAFDESNDLGVYNCLISAPNGVGINFQNTSGRDCHFPTIQNVTFIDSYRELVRFRGTQLKIDRLMQNYDRISNQEPPEGSLVLDGTGSITNCWIEGRRDCPWGILSGPDWVYESNYYEPHGIDKGTTAQLILQKKPNRPETVLEADHLYFVQAGAHEVHLQEGTRLVLTRTVDSQDTNGGWVEPKQCYKTTDRASVWFFGKKMETGLLVPNN